MAESKERVFSSQHSYLTSQLINRLVFLSPFEQVKFVRGDRFGTNDRGK
ncbi:hypothetical protein [Chamaesiphon sp. OTE_75_metabat_556]|nr:hypothetical protein [Chamaesiphon sp. OTE_75_metabat_556]